MTRFIVAALPRVVCLVGLLVPVACHAAPRVEFDLISEPGFPLGGEQRWLELFRAMKVEVRIQSGQGGTLGPGGLSGARGSGRGGAIGKPEVIQEGSERSPSYRVRGVLTKNNRLQLPGGSFGIEDRGPLTKWIEKLKDDGAESLTAKTGAFGLTEKQLVSLHEQLARPVGFSTRGQRVGAVVQKIAGAAGQRLVIDAPARSALEADDEVTEELSELSSGTALAAALRPVGLVLVPRKLQGGNLQLSVIDSRNATESWPVGWPTKVAPVKLVPKISTQLDVEFQNSPLPEVLATLQQRLECPLLIDQNSLARHRVDLETLQVTLPKTRTTYADILRKSLRTGKLHYDVRVDEAERPFLWITR